MKTMIKSIVMVFILLGNLCFAQLIQVTTPNMYSEVPIYKNGKGELYSTLITFQYSKILVDIPKGLTSFHEDIIIFPTFTKLLTELRAKYGSLSIIKAVPDAYWGDTLKINKRTKKLVKVPDFSQIYRIQFEKPIPIDSVTNLIKKMPNVLYAEGPKVAYTTLSPNDTWYLDSSYRWSFDVINSERAWNITTGSSNTRVGISDRFGTMGTVSLHQELTGKVAWDSVGGNYGDHGTQVAGVVGAITNNGQGIASLGWNTSVMLAPWVSAAAINSLVAHGADAINFSWVSSDYTDIRNAILSALRQGVVCVASAGNAETPVPGVRYPASYNFGNDGQVIAVSATILNSGTEQFLDSFNYSPGSDPINDPTNAFIDFTAPGSNYRALSDVNATDYVHIWAATSVSSPFVSALVALMYSVNNALTPNQVYDILKASADKVDQSRHPDNANGWNRWTGYGRINAFKALKYTLEHFGGTLTQSLTIPSGETWTFQPGVTVKFASGTSLTVNGTLNAIGTSSSRITFTRSGASGTWNGIRFNPGSSGSVKFCNINFVSNTAGIYCNNSSPTIEDNILNNMVDMGIYLYNASPSILRNTIQGSSSSYGYTGIRCEESSSPYIGRNTVRYFTTGVSAYRYGSPTFAENSSSGGYNKIVRTSTAIYGWYYSSPVVGSSSTGGNNYLDSASTLLVNAAWYTNIMAENNWWGSANPPANLFSAVSYSSIDYTPYLLSPPSLSIVGADPYAWIKTTKLMKTVGGTASAVSTDPSSNPIFDDEDLKAALQYEMKKEYQQASDIYEKVFKKELNTAKGRYALVKFGDCFFKLGRNGIDKYLSEISESYKSKKKDEISVIVLDLINRELHINKEYEKVADNLKMIKNDFSVNSEIEKSTLYGLVSFYVNCFNDTKTASSYYEELKQKYPKDKLITSCEILLGYKYDNTLNEKMVNGNEVNIKGEIDFTTGNYPNPFNPSTTISYTLPEAGKVLIKVFDVLGREVTTLVNESTTAGKHNVVWDGSNYASGIYFYSITFKGETLNKKMLLIK